MSGKKLWLFFKVSILNFPRLLEIKVRFLISLPLLGRKIWAVCGLGSCLGNDSLAIFGSFSWDAVTHRGEKPKSQEAGAWGTGGEWVQQRWIVKTRPRAEIINKERNIQSVLTFIEHSSNETSRGVNSVGVKQRVKVFGSALCPSHSSTRLKPRGHVDLWI